MGEVFRARDTTLGRDVALKVLPDNLAHDADRIARFRREAQMLAALNHPLIASIYGIDDSGVAPVLVLELVEGLTLAERISAGPLPLGESLSIALQVTEALGAAHERGIIHRDLKPSNIKLRPDGTVKVLDFGLARALEPAAGGVEPAAQATVTSPAVTAFGVILGTAAYMSPEQACGQAVDRGVDIWAFGAVLFEMLTGARPFDGSDPAQTIASVLRSEPDWARLPGGTPESIRRLLRRTLEKDRRRRLADIRDARLDIGDAQYEPVTPPGPRPARMPRTERLAWLGALAVVSTIAAALFLTRGTITVTRPERRVEIVTPPTTDPTSLALSPDGGHLAFVGVSQGRTEVWVRNLQSGAAQPLRGTDGASMPFWSPDSRSIAFFAAERLRRVSLDGSAARPLGVAIIGAGGTWNRAGNLLFPMVPDSVLYRLSQDGGQPVPLKMPPVQQTGGHRFPRFLPDGSHFLFFIVEARAVFIGSTDGSAPRRLLDADAAAVFVPPSEILFVRGGVLNSQRFDTSSLQLDGEPSPLAAGIAVSPIGVAAVTAADDGTIAYRSGSGAQERQLVWFDRSGTTVGTVGKPDASGPGNPALSPDGREVVFGRGVEGNADLWIADVERGIPTPLTRQPLPDVAPVWTPDGRAIVYSAAAAPGIFQIRTKPTASDADGSLLPGRPPIQGFPMHYSHDGRYLLYRAFGAPLSNWDIWAAPLPGDRAAVQVASSESDERTAQFSPEARLIAYESNKTGQYEIYVRPFLAPGPSVPVSSGGGSQPRWRRNSAGGEWELFYLSADRRLMSARVLAAKGQDISIARPRELFSIPVSSTVQGGTFFEYDVSPDGQRFLVSAFVERPAAPISLILDRRTRPR